MKFYSALFTVGAAAAVSKRQGGGIDTLLSDLQAVTDATTTLGTSISGYSGVGDAAAIISNVGAVSDAINTAVSDAGSAGTLSVVDASQLISPVQDDLTPAVSSAVDAAISKQDAFNADGLCSEVQNQLSTLQSGAQSLADALTAIVPENLQSTAQQLSGPILDDLQKAADAYSSCPSGGGSSTGPSSTDSGSAPSSTDSGSGPTTTGSASSTLSSPTPPTSPTGYTPSSSSSAPSGSVPPSNIPSSGPTSTPSGSAPPVYTGAAATFAPALGGLAAAGIAIMAL